ncbi:alpha/beta fold hydrolase [Phreatobacter stygius]|uniref:Alpha/beta fold hydrolase n=1 Tax=Phreatobacter stygius TaxID=1940610 RepID=A0A4D7BFA4_9HYPH|nr:alpha/beta fold hydrolase [Phreatobacter stygius]QCI68568.1 alpha/beta fold hydrolase [Phreatobacter stygius]
MATEPLVLVPGLNCTAALFAAQSQALGRTVQTIIADHTRDATIAGIADRLLADAPPQFALGGLSLGGYVALEVVRRAPERVTRLALLDTRASPDTDQDAEIRGITIKFAERGHFDEVHRLLWGRLVHDNRRHDSALEAVVHAMHAETGPEVFVRQQKAARARPDYQPGLQAIRCPTLVLVGDGDAVTPPFMSEDMAAAIPRAHLVVVPECGHLSSLERPDAVTAALGEWLTW